MYSEMHIFLVYALMSFDKHLYRITHYQAIGDLCLLRKFTPPFLNPPLLLHTRGQITTACLGFYSNAVIQHISFCIRHSSFSMNFN